MPYDSECNNSFAYLFTKLHPYYILKNDNCVQFVYGAICFREKTIEANHIQAGH